MCEVCDVLIFNKGNGCYDFVVVGVGLVGFFVVIMVVELGV